MSTDWYWWNAILLVPVTSVPDDDEMAVDPQGQEQDDDYEPVAGGKFYLEHYV